MLDPYSNSYRCEIVYIYRDSIAFYIVLQFNWKYYKIDECSEKETFYYRRSHLKYFGKCRTHN